MLRHTTPRRPGHITPQPRGRRRGLTGPARERARRTRITTALTATTWAAATALVFLTAWAPPAAAEVWAAAAGTRIFPSTKPGASTSIELCAARNEYEGVQIGVRRTWRRDVTVTWSPGSHRLLTGNSRLHEVKFVKVTRPTTASRGRRGYYPDPLVPREFGVPITVGATPVGPYVPEPAPKSASLYVLFHVPADTPAGTYSGTLRVANGDEVVDLPVSLRVWRFGWSRLSTPTAFVLNVNNLGKSIEGSGVQFKRQARQRIVQAAFKMLREHGVTPFLADALPKVDRSGDVDTADYRQRLAPYLGSTGLDLPATQIPWTDWFPYHDWRHTPDHPGLLHYLTTLCRFYRENGWQDRVYGFRVDEPTSTVQERRAEVLAATLHRASRRAGFRAPFLLTDDPRPTTLHDTLPANRFLWDDVDIWATRYYYYFGRVPVIRALQKQGVRSWWYTYANSKVREIPNFVLEKSPADQRVWGWSMHQWRVEGLLYWGTNRWGDAVTARGWRDPYKDPLSYWVRGARVCNGEAMLIYPGYYPRYGLDDPFAEPVSSLRLEALRDGLEDLEYLKLSDTCGREVRDAVRRISRTVTWYPHDVKYGHVFTYPRYRRTQGWYAAARQRVAELIEANLPRR